MTPPRLTVSALHAADDPAHVVCGAGSGARLVDYLKARLVLVPVNEVGDLITSGFVRIATATGSVVGRTADPVADGDRIAIDPRALAALEALLRWNPPWDHPLVVHHEDDDLLVVEKPAGMHVHPLGDKREHTLVNALVFHAGGRAHEPWARWRPHVVQRLDCVVSGMLVIAKNAAVKAALVRAQKAGRLQRTYRAMVQGRIAGDHGEIDAPVGRDPAHGGRRCILPAQQGGQPAVTRWNVLERYGDRTLVELEPETGRTHQLRVHLASIGHPIVGDRLYENARVDENAPAARPGASHGTSMTPHAGADVAAPARLENGAAIALHATALRLAHPRTRALLFFCALPPDDFGRAASGEAGGNA